MSTLNRQTGNKLFVPKTDRIDVDVFRWGFTPLSGSDVDVDVDVDIFRWGFTPLSEAERGEHKQVETILKLWTARFVLLNT